MAVSLDYPRTATPDDFRREQMQMHQRQARQADHEMQKYRAELELKQLREKQAEPLYPLRESVREWLNP